MATEKNTASKEAFLDTTIGKIWSRSEGEVEARQLKLAYDRLHADADRVVVEARAAVLDAETSYDKILTGNRKKPNFQSIVDAKIALEEKTLVLETAIKMYKEVLGQEPRS